MKGNNKKLFFLMGSVFIIYLAVFFFYFFLLNSSFFCEAIDGKTIFFVNIAGENVSIQNPVAKTQFVAPAQDFFSFFRSEVFKEVPEMKLLINQINSLTWEQACQIYEAFMKDSNTPKKHIWEYRYQQLSLNSVEGRLKDIRELLCQMVEYRRDYIQNKSFWVGVTETTFLVIFTLFAIGYFFGEAGDNNSKED